jgi:hypothetical protein
MTMIMSGQGVEFAIEYRPRVGSIYLEWSEDHSPSNLSTEPATLYYCCNLIILTLESPCRGIFAHICEAKMQANAIREVQY